MQNRAAASRSSIEVDTFVEGNQSALVVTRLTAEGSSVRNDVLLERRANGWTVVGYSLRPGLSACARSRACC